MKTLYSVIKKPAQLIEVFSAVKYFNLDKVVCYVPEFIFNVNYTKAIKIKYINYINSLNKKDKDFIIVLKKYQFGEGKIVINNILQKKNLKYLALVGEDTINRIKIFFSKKVVSIGVTDGSQDSFDFLDYFIICKSKKFINYIKIPILLFMYNFFKLDITFSNFPYHRYFFSKKTTNNYNFDINVNIKKILNKNKINILILEDPTKTLEFNEIIKRYNLNKKNYCSIGRTGVFRIKNKIYKNISLLPEVLINTGIIKKIYTIPQSSVYSYGKSKKLKIIKLPMKIFNYPLCASFFRSYISNRFLKIR